VADGLPRRCDGDFHLRGTQWSPHQRRGFRPHSRRIRKIRDSTLRAGRRRVDTGRVPRLRDSAGITTRYRELIVKGKNRERFGAAGVRWNVHHRRCETSIRCTPILDDPRFTPG